MDTSDVLPMACPYTSHRTQSQCPPVTLSWRNLSVRVRAGRSGRSPRGCWMSPPSVLGSGSDGHGKTILNNVTGSVEGGVLLAVVGASGTGKTTLLAAVTKRLTGESVSGSVCLNGREASGDLLAEVCGFVPQQDVTTETLTAQEHLTFMAALRLDARTSPSARARRVRVLLGDLGLADCADTRLAVMSGGERRRLAVAVQLLVSPLVLALDEPCSGLDSEGARLVLGALRGEAARGRAVLCTVHQASPDVLQLFHEILVLSGGRVAFHGPLDGAVPFFNRAGVRPPKGWPPGLPLTGILQQMCDPGPERPEPGYRGTAQEQDWLSVRNLVCKAFLRTELALHHLNRPLEQVVLNRDAVKPHEIMCVSWWAQLRWLVWRSALDTRRRADSHVLQVGIFLFTSILMSFVFSEARATTMAGVQGVRGLLYLIVSEVIFTHAYCVFNTFPGELPVYLRETQSKLYSPAAFYAAKVLIMVPRALLEPLLFVTIIHIQADVTSGGGLPTLIRIYGAVFLSALTATAYGSMLSAQFESPETVFLVTMPIEFLSLLTTGIFNTIRSLPFYLHWIKYLSMFFYSYEALSILSWMNVHYIECEKGEAMPCLSDGEEVLEDSGFHAQNLGRDLLGLALLCAASHCVGFFGVWRRSRKQATY